MNHIQYLVIVYNGKESAKGQIYIIYIYICKLNHFAVHCKSIVLQFKKNSCKYNLKKKISISCSGSFLNGDNRKERFYIKYKNKGKEPHMVPDRRVVQFLLFDFLIMSESNEIC